MRIGIIHSYYRSQYPSGENLTVNEIRNLLLDMGHQVSIWSFDSDLILKSKSKQIKQVLKIIFQRNKNQAFENWIEAHDVIQIHNYFPGITYSNLKSLIKFGKPIHRVIHNYRKTCIQGSHFRKNTLCEKCDLTRRLPGIINRCYNKSFISSFFISRYSKRIEAFEKTAKLDYIAISEVILEYLANIGIEKKIIYLIPNSVSASPAISILARDCVYFGRIEAEKGIFELLELWKMNPQLPTLHIIGNGTRLREVRLISKSLRNIVIHGAKYGEELEQILHISKVAIFPALWKEPFGRTIGESLARGQAVAISNNIQQKNIVSEGINGSIFEIAETEILGAVMKCLSLDVNKHIQISQKKWEESCSPAAVSNSWKNLYPILQNK